MKSKWVFTLLFVLLSTQLFPQINTYDPLKVERLAALGKLWGNVKYFHPYLAYKDIDWDSALVRAVPDVILANNKIEYAKAVQGMLDYLHDPLTKIEVTKETTGDTSRVQLPSLTWTEDSIIIFSCTDYRALEDYPSIIQKLTEVSSHLSKAKGVLFDLRCVTSSINVTQGRMDVFFNWSQIQKHLSSQTLVLPAFRKRLHSGFKPEDGYTSGGYYSSFEVQNIELVNPVDSAKDIPIIFLVNSKSDLPLSAWSLQKKNLAEILCIDDGDLNLPGYSRQIELSDGLKADLRTNEIISPDGSLNFRPDKIITRDGDIYSAAFSEMKDFPFHNGSGHIINFSLGTYSKESYPNDEGYPSREYRLLAAFKIWTVFNYFFPYKDLMNEDWDQVLKEYIPRFENAANAEEFRIAVQEMTAFTHDSHVFADWPSSDWAHPMFICRYIENKLVVDRIYSDSLKVKILPGDEIISINGKSIADLEKKFRPLIAASTEQSMKNLLARYYFYGEDGSQLSIVLKTKGNETRQFETTRSNAFWQYFRKGNQDNDIIRLISPEIGYADLDHLQVLQVDSMFQMLKNTKAIIFDMRGYPNGTAWAIAPRLNIKGKKIYGALFKKPLISLDENEDNEVSYSFYQPVPATLKPPYKGKIIVLIDERAMSQAEHTCLFFESAADVTFIGSPTVGANGDVTSFRIPGNLSISMTGQSVRHADGRQLQRVGIIPDIEILPTIEGIRSGKDEVLERAIEFINNGR